MMTAGLRLEGHRGVMLTVLLLLGLRRAWPRAWRLEHLVDARRGLLQPVAELKVLRKSTGLKGCVVWCATRLTWSSSASVISVFSVTCIVRVSGRKATEDTYTLGDLDLDGLLLNHRCLEHAQHCLIVERLGQNVQQRIQLV